MEDSNYPVGPIDNGVADCKGEPAGEKTYLRDKIHKFLQEFEGGLDETKNLYGVRGILKECLEQNDALEAQLADTLKREGEAIEQLAKADDEIERLRGVIKEIEDVSCGEEQIKADGDYNDTDGLKWIYDRIQAEQALQEKK